MRLVPRSVAVIANKRAHEWETALASVQVQFMVLTIFRGRDGRTAYELDGDLQVVKESLGFGSYSALDRAVRMPASTLLPDGEIQITEAGGGVSWWVVARSGPTLWLSKKLGTPDLADRETIQILRGFDGRTSLRRCAILLSQPTRT